MSGNFRKKLLDEKLPFFVLLFSFSLSLFFLALHSFLSKRNNIFRTIK